jgi:hypothetical protein
MAEHARVKVIAISSDLMFFMLVSCCSVVG